MWTMKTLSVFPVLLLVSQHALCVLVKKEGEEALLLCKVDSPVPPTSTVEWSRNDLSSKIVHLMRNNIDLPDDQNPRYRGRTSLRPDAGATGDLSLTLKQLSVFDNATYTCTVRQGGINNPQPPVTLLVEDLKLSPGEVAGIVIGVILAFIAGLIIGFILRPRIQKAK